MKTVKFKDIKRDELTPVILAEILAIKTRFKHLLKDKYTINLGILNN